MDLSQDPTHDMSYWQGKWAENDIGFHREETNPLLTDHFDHMLAGRETIKVFVPLCGKSKDMIWLAEHGHSVVGVECSEMAVSDFFKENNITCTKHKVDALPDAFLYKSEDDRIHVYACDLFTFNVGIEGTFQGIWDRGSLVAVDKEDRVRYSKLMRSVMAPDCRYLLVALEYDDTLYHRDPHRVGYRDIETLYGEIGGDGSLSITPMFHLVRPAPTSGMIEVGIMEVHETVYLLKN